MPKSTLVIKTGITLILTCKMLKITFKIICPQKCNHKLTLGSMITLVMKVITLTDLTHTDLTIGLTT